jgi:hypothetical protein
MGAHALAAHLTLERLYLSLNHIDCVGAALLAQNTSIKELNLSWNLISGFGAAALANNTTLEMLNLSHNQLGTKGSKYFLSNSTLKFLDVCFNQVSLSITQTMALNWKANQLQMLEKFHIMSRVFMEQIICNRHQHLRGLMDMCRSANVKLPKELVVIHIAPFLIPQSQLPHFIEACESVRPKV